MTERNVVNQRVRNALGEYKNSDRQVFSGTDLKCVMYLPLLTTNSAIGKNKPKIKVFGDLQTISISSARAVGQARVLGKSNPVGTTRGAITYAGTMVFSVINQDAFADIFDSDLAEGFINSSTSVMAHQLPPFSVVINAANESGAAGIQVIHGITITNFGTTYSIDDLYVESTYTYIATDLTPLVVGTGPIDYSVAAESVQRFGKNMTQLVAENVEKAYSLSAAYVDRIRRRTNNNTNNSI